MSYCGYMFPQNSNLEPLLYICLVGPLNSAFGTQEAKAKGGVAAYSFEEFIALGKSKPVEAVPPKPDDLTTIMYTSGTTGDPKGVMLSHDAVVKTISSGLEFIEHQLGVHLGEGDVFLSYLPLAHILDRYGLVINCFNHCCWLSPCPFSLDSVACFYPFPMFSITSLRTSRTSHGSIDIFISILYTTLHRVAEELFITIGGCLGYWQGDIKLLIDDIAELKPHFFAGVPRVFERIYSGIKDKVDASGFIKKFLFGYGFDRKLHAIQRGVALDKVRLKLCPWCAASVPCCSCWGVLVCTNRIYVQTPHRSCQPVANTSTVTQTHTPHATT